MSKSRKKIQQSDSEDKISIFDSEDDGPTVHRESSKAIERQGNSSEKVGVRGRKAGARTREKKLSRDEQSIMRTLLGQQSKQAKQSVPKEHSLLTQSKLDRPFPPYNQPVKVIPQSKPIHSIFDLSDLRIQDSELTWLDLQCIYPEYSTFTARETTHLTHPNHSQTPTYNADYLPNQTHNRRPYRLHYNKRNTRRFANPRIHSYRGQNARRARYPIDYHSPYEYNNPRGYTGSYLPDYNQLDRYQQGYGYAAQNRMGRFEQYPAYKNYQISDHYASHPHRSNHIISELQETQNRYQQGLSHEDLHEGIVGYNTVSEEKLQQQPVSAKMEEQLEKKEELTRDQSENRRKKILEEIEKLKEQFIHLEDQDENLLEQITLPGSAQIQHKIKVTASQLWQFEPLPQPINYPAPSKESSDNKYQKSKTDGRITMIELILKQNPFLTQFQMAEVLKALDPILNARIERSVVLRLLKMSGYKKKKIIFLSKQRNSPSNLNIRKQFALYYQFILSQNYSLAYYDELIINQYFDKESGWCKEEEEIEMRPEKFISRSLTVLAVLSKEGGCYWEARFGQICEDEFAKVLSKILKKVGQGKSKRQLIVNQLKYRRAHHLQEVARRRGWELSVLPKQSLYLNPLQFYFAQVKDKLKRKKFETLEGLFSETVQTLLQCDKQKTGERVVGKIDVFIEKALMRQNF